MFPGKSFFSAHEVSTCKISGCLSYRILDSGPDGTQTTLTDEGSSGKVVSVRGSSQPFSLGFGQQSLLLMEGYNAT
ncbi:hypothetical protein KSI10_22915, partial [Salmonella enterica subsp. enterica serovar Indiana]|nr:hypothetical protein [Salmonella enterica subsp. enterica serovar Indiana]